jgi:glutamate-1-semialdehyde 2,1-aminomutase
LEYNDVAELKNAFDLYGDQIACVVVEPFAGNMNLVRPSAEFMQTMRELCTQHKSVLIFDEVMTGFRVDLGCAQKLLGITPDLTTLGKVIGGGMPLAGFGGKAEIMDCLAPLGGVYQAGTLSGNPIAVTAGLANLQLIQEAGFYDGLSDYTRALMQGLCDLAARHGIEFCADAVGGMFGFYFAAEIPTSFAAVKLANNERFNRFFHLMLDEGVFLAPSMFEAGFVCAKHDAAALAKTLAAADKAFAQLG